MSGRADAARPSVFEFADRVAAETAAGDAAAPAAPGALLHLIAFRLDAEEFGIPIALAREVIRVGDITRVPQAPEHIRGVTNLRGRILPVVEIRTRLGLAPAVPDARSRIVVTELRGRLLGLLVDSVEQVLKVAADRVVPAPEEVRGAQAEYLTAVAHLDQRLVMLLDLERALAPSPAASPASS